MTWLFMPPAAAVQPPLDLPALALNIAGPSGRDLCTNNVLHWMTWVFTPPPATISFASLRLSMELRWTNRTHIGASIIWLAAAILLITTVIPITSWHFLPCLLAGPWKFKSKTSTKRITQTFSYSLILISNSTWFCHCWPLLCTVLILLLSCSADSYIKQAKSPASSPGPL